MSDLSYRVIPPEMVPEDMREKVAFVSGKAEEYERCRALAFGAIRRAAEVARKYDEQAKDWERLAYYTQMEYAETGYEEFVKSQESERHAVLVRHAIRFAIRSPKA